jgi:putative oxidoreductase
MKNLLQVPALSPRASTGLLVLRILCGVAFMLHGVGKIQNPFAWMGPTATIPGFFQGLAALSEFGGGLAWIVGLLTPLASLGLLCTMAVAVYFHAVVMGDPFVPSGPGQGSYELAAIFFCVSLLFILAGPGRYSLDRKIFGEK